jgi:hypothetical protein
MNRFIYRVLKLQIFCYWGFQEFFSTNYGFNSVSVKFDFELFVALESLLTSKNRTEFFFWHVNRDGCWLSFFPLFLLLLLLQIRYITKWEKVCPVTYLHSSLLWGLVFVHLTSWIYTVCSMYRHLWSGFGMLGQRKKGNGCHQNCTWHQEI